MVINAHWFPSERNSYIFLVFLYYLIDLYSDERSEGEYKCPFDYKAGVVSGKVER